MGAIVALIPTLLPLLESLPGDVMAVINWIASIRTAAQQSGEWTAEAEAAWRASVQAQAAAPEQQTDVQVVAQTGNVLTLAAAAAPEPHTLARTQPLAKPDDAAVPVTLPGLAPAAPPSASQAPTPANPAVALKSPAPPPFERAR